MEANKSIQPVNTGTTKSPRMTKSPKTAQAQPSALVASYAAAAQSNATTRSYDADIRHFKQHGGSIPATPTMVAEYLANFAEILAVSTLRHRLIAIHRAHTDGGLPSPAKDQIVRRTMQGIRRKLGVRQRRVTALVKDDLLEIIVHLEQEAPLRASRDKAILLIGFAGALRRSELVSLRWEDMTNYDSGLELLLRRSKTDQEGAGRTVFIPYATGSRCPVKALHEWLKIANITSGPLFLRISRYGKIIGHKALTPQSVALIVKKGTSKLTRGAGHDYSGHSLRAGYCTEAALMGLQSFQIREQTGHTSDVTLARYIRPLTKRKIPSLL
jgi:integrase